MGKRLYVGNLPYDADEAALRAAFAQDGRAVERVHIVIDRETQRPRGFAFIEMATEELSAMLFAAHPALEELESRLEKPEALRGRAAAGGASVTRTRASFPLTRRTFPGGHADCILETHEATLDLITLEPNASYAPTAARRVAWLTAGALAGTRVPVDAGEALRVEPPFDAGPEGASLFVCEAATSP